MNSIEAELSSRGIEFTRYDHPAVFTCEEADLHCSHVPGLACKNLLVKDKKTKRYYLLILPAKKRLDMKKIKQEIGSKDISFASAEALMEKLGLEPGSVSPFGLLNNSEADVTVWLDTDLAAAELVGFHPNVNTATLCLSQEMFRKFLDGLEHEWKVVEMG